MGEKTLKLEVRSMSEVFQESIRSLSGVCQIHWTNSVLELCYAPLISPLQFQPKYYELSKWALQISSPNKFSKWEKKPQKLKVKSLSEVFQEYFRSLSGVSQESVKNLLVALVNLGARPFQVTKSLKVQVRSLTNVHQESVRSLSVQTSTKPLTYPQWTLYRPLLNPRKTSAEPPVPGGFLYLIN